MSALFWMIIGAFIGWNLPQPSVAKVVQAKVVDFVKKFTSR